MKSYLIKLIKWKFRIIGTIIFLIINYFTWVFGLSYVPVHSDFKQCDKDAVQIYILTNGVHTDLVLPIKNEYKDWSKFVDPANTKSGSIHANYVAFGWGDKGFYLGTPKWSDLKFKTAFNALFFLSTTAMHVTFYDMLKESESCKKICISKESYLQLISYIDKSFTPDNSGNYQLIKGASYWRNDSFYEAKGTYSLFFTCNTWVNSGLKKANLKACLWTPFDKGIFYQYSE